MADWSNVRLVVAGAARDIAAFRREAKPFLRLAKGDPQADVPDALSAPDALFDPEMLHGEGGDLFEYSFARLAVGATVQYGFQTARVNEITHFKKVSRRFPQLLFVVSWGHTNVQEFGSALISRGRAKIRKLSDKKIDETYGKFVPDPEADNDETFWQAHDAEENMIDQCAEFWNHEIFQDRSKRRVRIVPAQRPALPRRTIGGRVR